MWGGHLILCPPPFKTWGGRVPLSPPNDAHAILAWRTCVYSGELGLRESFAIASSEMRIDVTANIKVLQTVININSSAPFFQGVSKIFKIFNLKA